MKLKPLFIIALTYVVALAGGCAGGRNEDVLARIDRKDTITLEGFNDRISKLPERYQKTISQNKKAFLDELIVDVLLYNEALRKKLDRDKDVNKVLEEAKRKILIARLLQDEVENKITVDEKEITDYYNQNKEKLTVPEVLRASHILLRTEKEAKDVMVELSNGRNFEDLARARSIDPTSKVGGDVGYFARRQLVPEFEDVCFNMQVGEISGIVKTEFGYHIIKLTERKEPRVKELSEVRDAIEQSLKRFKKKILFNEFVESLKEKSQISVNKTLLKTISSEEPPEEKSEG